MDDLVDREALFEAHRCELNCAAQRVGAVLVGVLVPSFSILDCSLSVSTSVRFCLYD